MILLAEVECLIYDAQSLKQKRSVVKSIITRIQNDYNIAISEINYQDLWQRTQFGLVTISSDKVQSERVIHQALRLIDSFPEIERTTTNLEWV
ncbi:DUF503 family protein [Aquibacillus koreensis]|uniref:DUF503 family protein n=1 Tax=Aquibacillus koreensis TaxID=279446 RepID=A0A9X4AKW0_9BACI|nr:DUF503 family protein [Aquibacillus koreensis]MCT2534566.1 DUF503 family protein [Aquibacillus koreensis]MDC3421840.1 DUF503 family protein [Aquibacillus koreensis]